MIDVKKHVKGVSVNPIAWYLISRHALKLAYFKSGHSKFEIKDTRRRALTMLGFTLYKLLVFKRNISKANRGSFRSNELKSFKIKLLCWSLTIKLCGMSHKLAISLDV